MILTPRHSRCASVGFAVFGFAVLVLGGACGGGSAMDASVDSGPRPTCEAIVDRCHPLDPGSGPIRECHEFAESAAATEAMCMARQAACNAACVATDAGAIDAAVDGASDSGPQG